MSAPKFVPVAPIGAFRAGTGLPPSGEWTASRPAEVRGAAPNGAMMGRTGPDQGYALKLARLFTDRLVLGPHEHEHDVTAGCVGVAMKRAALYGRAPVVHDLDVAYTLFGFLRESPAALTEWRAKLFQAAGHHYEIRRAIVDLVPDETLRLAPAILRTRVTEDWRALLDLP